MLTVAICLCLPLLLKVATTTTTTTAQSMNGLQCQRISAPECQGLGYNMTAMPNLAGDSNQLDAELRLAKLLPLIESDCSTPARFLLCSSLFPLCTPHVERPISACKSLCETVKCECDSNAELMQLWPDFLNCDGLPQPDQQELCMQIPRESLNNHEQRTDATLIQTPASPQTQPQPDSHPPTQPQSTPQRKLSWPWSSWTKLPAHLTRPITPPLVCPQNFTINPLQNDECLPQCNRDAFHSTQQKKIAESLILGLSAVCFVFTLFSLVTFWAEPTRFGYPERPVLFLCLCYNLFSICYLERIIFHNSSRANAVLQDLFFGKRSLPCALSPPCLASYITTSYLSLCAATWWLIFSLCFFLSSHKKWSSEALEKKSGLFHVLAWVPPLAPPIAALLLERVRPNELTGMCLAPGFAEIPTTLLLLIGLFFTIRASHSLHALQQQMQQALGNQRFSQIRKRFLIFSLMFFLPTATSVIAALFERYRRNALPACASDIEDCMSPPQITSWPTLMRIFFQLTGGTLTGMWVWSRKTCESYRNRIISTSASSASIKSASKKNATGGKFAGGPLYSGINFHNIPVYSPHQSRV